MPAKDRLHELLKTLLQSAGWIITHDPLYLPYGTTKTFADFGASAPIGAQNEGRAIAIELKGFASRSEISELEKALGQYAIYRAILSRREPERDVFLALPLEAYLTWFDLPEGEALRVQNRIKLLVFDPLEEEIVQWIE